MTGRKSLKDVRRELESALGNPVNGEGEVAEALRRFMEKAVPTAKVVEIKPKSRSKTGATRIPPAKAR